MDISIGLPATIPGVSGKDVLGFARRADAGPFYSLGIIDRLVFPNFEPLVTLAAAGAVTSRILLTTTVLLAPLRETGVFAKEAASVDALSGGRLRLGVGVGTREDDYRYAGVEFHDRGRRLDGQLEEWHRIWSGQPLPGIGTIGPEPRQHGGPPMLIGGFSRQALARLGRWGIGYISGGAPARQAEPLYRAAEEVWAAAGRPGKPRLVGSSYCALGRDGKRRGGEYIRMYYGEEFGGRIAEHLPDSASAIREMVESFRAVGADELFLWPTTPDLDQVDELASIIHP